MQHLGPAKDDLNASSDIDTISVGDNFGRQKEPETPQEFLSQMTKDQLITMLTKAAEKNAAIGKRLQTANTNNAKLVNYQKKLQELCKTKLQEMHLRAKTAENQLIIATQKLQAYESQMDPAQLNDKRVMYAQKETQFFQQKCAILEKDLVREREKMALKKKWDDQMKNAKVGSMGDHIQAVNEKWQSEVEKLKHQLFEASQREVRLTEALQRRGSRGGGVKYVPKHQAHQGHRQHRGPGSQAAPAAMVPPHGLAPGQSESLDVSGESGEVSTTAEGELQGNW